MAKPQLIIIYQNFIHKQKQTCLEVAINFGT